MYVTREELEIVYQVRLHSLFLGKSVQTSALNIWWLAVLVGLNVGLICKEIATSLHEVTEYSGLRLSQS